jgi:hypothetical protein
MMDGTIEYLNRIRHPDIFGPGWWWFLQNEALDAQSKEEIEYFIRKLPRRLASLPCAKCRYNAARYIEENPPRRYAGLKDGMYRYVWEFHNYKNKEKGKPIVPFEKAINFQRFPFTEGIRPPDEFGVCDDCGTDSSHSRYENVPNISIIKRR